MNREAVDSILLGLVVLVVTRGRFTIRKRSSNRFRLFLSIVVAFEARGVIQFFLNKVGGTTRVRETRSGRNIVVWEIHDQEMLATIVNAVLQVQSDGLELPERMQKEISVAWSFLQTPVFVGRLDEERRRSNQEAMEERRRLYELLKEE